MKVTTVTENRKIKRQGKEEDTDLACLVLEEDGGGKKKRTALGQER